MKYILPLLMLFVFALPLMAQDPDVGVESYVYQGNSLCEFAITIQSHAPIEYHLTSDGGIYGEGTLGADDEIEMRIPISGQWFILVIEHAAADENPYTLTSGLACGEESETSADGAPVVPVDPELQAHLKEELGPLIEMLMDILQEK